MVQTRVIGDKGGHIMALTSLTLNLIFEVISRSKWFFRMEKPSFDHRFAKSGKFYVQNPIEIFFPRLFQGQMYVKLRKVRLKSFFSMNHGLSWFKLIVGLIEETRIYTS